MNKQAELERLNALVFEGAPEWAKWAAMDEDQNWYLFKEKPLLDTPTNQWLHTSVRTRNEKPCDLLIEFHKTDLDWTETLIERKALT